GQYPFQSGAEVETVERFGVGDACVFHSAAIFPVTVLGADTRIVESCGNRVDRLRLSVGILKHVAVTAVEHARLAMAQAGGMFARSVAPAACLHPNQFDPGIANERSEHSGRIAAAADAGDDYVRQSAILLEALRTRLFADDR